MPSRIGRVTIHAGPASGLYLFATRWQVVFCLTLSCVLYGIVYVTGWIGEPLRAGAWSGGLVGVLVVQLTVLPASFSWTPGSGSNSEAAIAKLRACAGDLGYVRQEGSRLMRPGAAWWTGDWNFIDLEEADGRIRVSGPWSVVRTLRRRLLKSDP